MPFPPTPSNSPSNTPTPSITASQTPTNTPTGTQCPDITRTPTSTPTATISFKTYLVDTYDCDCNLLLINQILIVTPPPLAIGTYFTFNNNLNIKFLTVGEISYPGYHDYDARNYTASNGSPICDLVPCFTVSSTPTPTPTTTPTSTPASTQEVTPTPTPTPTSGSSCNCEYYSFTISALDVESSYNGTVYADYFTCEGEGAVTATYTFAGAGTYTDVVCVYSFAIPTPDPYIYYYASSPEVTKITASNSSSSVGGFCCTPATPTPTPTNTTTPTSTGNESCQCYRIDNNTEGPLDTTYTPCGSVETTVSVPANNAINICVEPGTIIYRDPGLDFPIFCGISCNDDSDCTVC